jgi:transposase
MSLAAAGSRVARRSAIAVSYIRSSPSRVWVGSGFTYGTDVQNCQELRGLPVGKLLDRCRRLRQRRTASTDELVTRLVLRSLALRIAAATNEAEQLERELLGQVRALAPGLLDELGVGPVVAAQLIVGWSHQGVLGY